MQAGATMKRNMICLAAAFFLLAGAAFSQSLADLAKKEQERREQIKKNSKVITNDDTQKYKAGAVTTGSAPPAAASQKPGTDKPSAEAGVSPKDAKPEPDEPVDFQGRPESYWRQTMSDARKLVKDLENGTNVLILRLNDLQNQFYRESDGFKQQEIQKQIQKTLYEQDLNKDQLAKAKAQLQELEKEARKSGALPGWLTDKNP